MNVPWWKKGIIYEIYPRSFQDTNGDGVGDLRGIIKRLDYLNDGTENSLGVDAIWITPFYPSPFYDFGYDIKDYCNIDPLFGTMEDFELLVKEAHKRGIKIIIDLVLNHTSHLHPWFVESRSSKESSRRDWYIWKDAPKGKCKPNNWQAFFGGSAWTFDKKTGQYYLHSFLKEQPDLNWRNREVKEALFDVIRFWLEKEVDGFRLDVINFIYKDKEFKSNPGCFGRRPYEMQKHLYDRNQPEVHETLQQLRQLVDSYGEKMLVGEIVLDKDDDACLAASYYGSDNNELHMAFNFEFLNCPWNGKAFKDAVERWEKCLPHGGWPNYVLSNHDVPRHYSRYGKGANSKNRAKVAALMLLTLRGTPFLYYGEEIGMRNVWVPRWKFQDPVGKRYWPFHPGRDEERTPMQWDDTLNSGFTTRRPWLPIARDFKKVNVISQSKDPSSLLSFYRKIIWCRKKTPALITGEYRSLSGDKEECFAYLRQYDSQKYLIALNFSSKTLRINFFDIDIPERGKLIFSTRDDFRRDEIELKPLDLKGDEGVLIQLT